MKKHIKSITCGLLCFIIIISAIFCARAKETPVLKTQKKDFILELWHIDSFEGGKGSRKDYLLSSALKFEKTHNVIVSVISHTIESASIALQTSVPDMISCGNGLDIVNFVKSMPIKSYDNVARLNDKNYGISWCRGGYAFIGEGAKDTLIVSQAEYTLPLVALKQSKETFKTVKVLSPLKAYQEYLRGGAYLLGTQRDIIRLINRGENVKYAPISCFCDLYQVITITSTSRQKIKYCESFISFLLSPERQQSLEKIGMLSVTDQKLYKGELLEDLQNAKIEKVQNFFTSPTILKNITLSLQEELKTC